MVATRTSRRDFASEASLTVCFLEWSLKCFNPIPFGKLQRASQNAQEKSRRCADKRRTFSSVRCHDSARNHPPPQYDEGSEIKLLRQRVNSARAPPAKKEFGAQGGRVGSKPRSCLTFSPRLVPDTCNDLDGVIGAANICLRCRTSISNQISLPSR
jgi:hypothetical protein